MKILGFVSSWLLIFGSSPLHADLLTSITAFDGVKLTAQFGVPAGIVKKAFVILPGSGNVAIDGDVSSPLLGRGYQGKPAKLSDQIADLLDSQNIASLRYNKRGVDDPAQLSNQTMTYLVRDAKSALAELRTRFPSAQVGIIGFSEGALLATYVAADESVDSLYLLSLPTRSIDESLSYQFLQWPVELLEKRLKTASNGDLVPTPLTLPLLGSDWKTIDSDHNGTLSITQEIIPTYSNYFSNIQAMLKTPAYSQWYAGLKALPLFSIVASKVTATTFIYEPMENAQNNWSWVVADQLYFTGNHGRTHLQTFLGLGHCFAPMDGQIGEIKTSGPLSPDLLQALSKDLNRQIVN